MNDRQKYRWLETQRSSDGVETIVLKRPEKRNALSVAMTYELDAALVEASLDERVKVILIRATGPDFCAGHDLAEKGPVDSPLARSLTGLAPLRAKGIDGLSAFERELFYELPERWRSLPKPTIAVVQGRCIAGGLSLAMSCDLIVAGRGATFEDPTVMLGASGPEFFTYPFDLGARVAKHLLFTGDALTAEAAHALGLVCHVADDNALQADAEKLAGKIAAKPAFALRMTKEAINLAEDLGGRRGAMQATFHIHQLCHAENLLRHRLPVDPTGLPPRAAETVRRFTEEHVLPEPEARGLDDLR